METGFFLRGWVRFPSDPSILLWAKAARGPALRAAEDAEARAAWLRCGGTWFAGVNILPNDADGGIAADGVPPLSGAPIAFVRNVLKIAPEPWDQAQISVCYPGYPQPSEDESAAAFAYRRNRDAAHVDGLKRDAARRRRPGETHAFILGLPLTETGPGASPLVVWEGSHEVMRRALTDALAGMPPERWSDVDVTEAYHSARRECFETLERVEVAAQPGESYLLHRLALHGVAPWRGDETRPRAIAYFRPVALNPDAADWWLTAP